MPRYDFKCHTCGEVFEAITPSYIHNLPCISCVSTKVVDGVEVLEHIADRQLSAPSHIHIN